MSWQKYGPLPMNLFLPRPCFSLDLLPSKKEKNLFYRDLTNNYSQKN